MIAALRTISAGATLAFLALPLVVVAVSSFSSAGYMQFPPSAFSLRWYAAFLSDAHWIGPLIASALLATLSAAVVCLFALAAALARCRLPLPAGAFFDLLMLSPLFVPHAAAALGLWIILVSLGWLGTWSGLALTHAIVCFPFAYRPIYSAVSGLDIAMEEAALSLGAAPGKVLFSVTLPLLRPGLAAAFLFSFIISFDEVSVTMFLVGPDVTTLPVKVFTEIQENGSPVVAAISSFLMATTAIAVLILDRYVGVGFFVSHSPPPRRLDSA